jgi:hypothetical protein
MSQLKNISPVPQLIGEQVVAPGRRSGELEIGEHEQTLLDAGLLLDVSPEKIADPLEALSLKELRAQADARGVTVEGTGSSHADQQEQ